MADRSGPGGVEHGEEIRMERRLAARNLHEVRLAFACDQRVEHALDGRERQMLRPRRRGLGKAHRAGEVAMVVDLDERQAGMLFMIRTEPAIIRAAVFGVALQRERPVTGLDVLLAAQPIRGIG